MFILLCQITHYHTIPYHTQIFNLALDTGIVPTDWCIGLICTIYKNKGQRNDPDNYRGISLLSYIGELVTSCLKCSYIECQQMISNEQAVLGAGTPP